MRLDPPSAVGWIVRTLEEAGFETWVVGGAIRDGHLHVPHEDWDLATSARPKDVQRLFRRTVPIGVEHGTVGVLANDRTLYEVTTFRRDVENLGRRAIVEFADSVEDDLARRDFTINAVAWHPSRDELRDPFNGIDDLEAQCLRTVGDAGERFSEDYLRVLRALRFAGRYRFRVDPPTWTALCEAVPRLTVLSAERVREELLKVLILDPSPSGALSLYAASGALGLVLPEVSATADPGSDLSWTRRVLTIDALKQERPMLRLSALLAGLERASATAVLFRLRFSNAQVRSVSEVVESLRHHPQDQTPESTRRWLSLIGPENLSAWVRIRLAQQRVDTVLGRPGTVALSAIVRSARRELQARTPITLDMLQLDGRDLIGMGLRPGPAFSQILETLLDRVLTEPSLNTRDQLTALAGPIASSLEAASPRGRTK